MGIWIGLRPDQIKSRFDPNYRERALCLLRADVTKTRNLSVENSAQIGKEGLVIGWRPLAGGYISRFGQAEG
jgi:hypothetical protein